MDAFIGKFAAIAGWARTRVTVVDALFSWLHTHAPLCPPNISHAKQH